MVAGEEWVPGCWVEGDREDGLGLLIVEEEKIMQRKGRDCWVAVGFFFFFSFIENRERQGGVGGLGVGGEGKEKRIEFKEFRIWKLGVNSKHKFER